MQINNDNMMSFLSEDQFRIDELGRIIIEDPELLAEINGAFSASDATAQSLSNGACANGACF